MLIRFSLPLFVDDDYDYYDVCARSDALNQNVIHPSHIRFETQNSLLSTRCRVEKFSANSIALTTIFQYVPDTLGV